MKKALTILKAILIGAGSLVLSMIVIGLGVAFAFFGWMIWPMVLAAFAGLAYYDMKRDGTL